MDHHVTLLGAFDSETFLIAPGNSIPQHVCTTRARYLDNGPAKAEIFHARPGDAWRAFMEWLDSGYILVGHQIDYDLAVAIQYAPAGESENTFRKVDAALRAGRFRCTKLRAKLLDIYDGQRRGGQKPYALNACADRFLGEGWKESAAAKGWARMKDSADSWRLRYGELYPHPINVWPQEAIDYACDDATNTLLVFLAQHESLEKRAYWDKDAPGYGERGAAAVDEVRRVDLAFWLRLASAWGVNTDPEAVAALRSKMRARMDSIRPAMIKRGFMRPTGEKIMAPIRGAIAQSFASRGLQVPMTEPSAKFPDGQVMTDRETLWACPATDEADGESVPFGGEDDDGPRTGVPPLRLLAEFGHAQKIDTSFVEAFSWPGIPICTNLNALVDTGRTSAAGGKYPDPVTGEKRSYGGNFQNLPREKGVRQCVIPRPGHLFSSQDFPILELYSLAQTHKDLGIPGRLYLALRNGADPHAWLGASLARQEIGAFMADLEGKNGGEKKTAAKKWRQLAKILNFGFPGGMGAESFVSYAANQAEPVFLTVAQAQALKDQWLSAFPEMARYFGIARALFHGKGSTASLRQHRSGRIAGRRHYTEWCNGNFQGLGADCATDSFRRTSRACWLDRSSDLYGSRVWNFVHDENLLESEEEIAEMAARECARQMEEAACEWLPDVAPRAIELSKAKGGWVKPTLMSRWEKAAEPQFDPSTGALIPWDAGEAA